MTPDQRVPVLANGVRLRTLAEGRAVLLVPEGVVNLTSTAAATLALVDGARPCDAIAAELSARFAGPQAAIAADVDELFERLAARGWVFFSSAQPAS